MEQKQKLSPEESKEAMLFNQLMNYHISAIMKKECGMVEMEQIENGYEVYFQTTSELKTTNGPIVKKGVYKCGKNNIWTFEVVAYRKKYSDFVREEQLTGNNQKETIVQQ